MEASVIKDCDQLVTVSWTWAQEYAALGAEGKCKSLPMDLILRTISPTPPQSEQFLCSHIGYLNTDRNNHNLWKAFGELAEEIPGFERT